jgi:hypothetical protein
MRIVTCLMETDDLSKSECGALVLFREDYIRLQIIQIDMILVYVMIILNSRKRLSILNNNEIFCLISTFWENGGNSFEYLNSFIFQTVTAACVHIFDALRVLKSLRATRKKCNNWNNDVSQSRLKIECSSRHEFECTLKWSAFDHALRGYWIHSMVS